jgi:hypothetical protein
MYQQSQVFAISFVEQAQVQYVNELSLLTKECQIFDHAVVLSDSTFVIEAASISGLSAHQTEFSSDFIGAFDSFASSEEVYLSSDMNLWFVYLDSKQEILKKSEVEEILEKVTTESSLSVFRSKPEPVARFFTAAAFERDASFVASDLQWINLTTDEMYK